MTDDNAELVLDHSQIEEAKQRLRVRLFDAIWSGHVNSPEEQRRIVDTYFSGNGPRCGDAE